VLQTSVPNVSSVFVSVSYTYLVFHLFQTYVASVVSRYFKSRSDVAHVTM
jgi:hypothetical protein